MMNLNETSAANPVGSDRLPQFRAEGITDKDAAVLYGAVSTRSIYDLWKSKIELTDPGEPEPSDDLFVTSAIARWKKELIGPKNIEILPVAFVHKAMPFLRATSEAACPAHSFFARVVPQVPEDHAKVNLNQLPIEMRVPRRYLIEIRHTWIVSGYKRAFFVSVAPNGDTATVEIPRDQVFESNHVAECIQFWDCVRRGVLPPGVREPISAVEGLTCEHGAGPGVRCEICDYDPAQPSLVPVDEAADVSKAVTS